MPDNEVPIRWVLPDKPVPTARATQLIRNERRVKKWLSYLRDEEIKDLLSLITAEGERRGFGRYWWE